MRRVGALLVALMMLGLVAPAHAQPRLENKRIIMVYSHNPNAPGVVAFANQLKAVVRQQIITGEIYDEYLDVVRFPDPSHSDHLARYFTEKYRTFRPDAIVAEGSPALKFTVERLLAMFPGVPVVYGGTYEPILDFSSLPANVVGRHQLLPFASTYSLAHALQPDAERVVVIGGATPTDSLLTAEARRQITPLLNGVSLDVYQHWSYPQLLDSLRHFQPRTMLLFSDFSRDDHGAKFIPGDLIASLTRVASVPAYGIARPWVGDGIVGGGVMDFGNDGAQTGKLLMRVLARSRGDPMPASEVADNTLVVDWRQLQRWNLSEARLPNRTEVLFRPVSLWQRYRGGILIILGVLVVESLLIALLLLERERRLRAQRDVEESRGQVEHLARVATLNGLAAAVSHELRQPLAAIRMNAAAGERLLAHTSPDLPEARSAMQDITRDVTRASEVIEQFRALTRKQDAVTTSVDLNAVCRDTAKLLAPEAVSRGARMDLQLDPTVPHVRGNAVQLQQAVINLTLNALESLNGSVSHREIGIRTVSNNGGVEIHVSDTGTGLSEEVQKRLFEPFFTTKPHGLGIGVTIVRSIVELHHGKLRAENRPAGGALFTVTLPAAREA